MAPPALGTRVPAQNDQATLFGQKVARGSDRSAKGLRSHSTPLATPKTAISFVLTTCRGLIPNSSFHKTIKNAGTISVESQEDILGSTCTTALDDNVEDHVPYPPRSPGSRRGGSWWRLASAEGARTHWLWDGACLILVPRRTSRFLCLFLQVSRCSPGPCTCRSSMCDERWQEGSGVETCGVSGVHTLPWVHPLCQFHEVFREVAA